MVIIESVFCEGVSLVELLVSHERTICACHALNHDAAVVGNGERVGSSGGVECQAEIGERLTAYTDRSQFGSSRSRGKLDCIDVDIGRIHRYIVTFHCDGEQACSCIVVFLDACSNAISRQ